MYGFTVKDPYTRKGIRVFNISMDKIGVGIMLITEKKLGYKIFGLNLSSEIVLAELPVWSEQNSIYPADLEIKVDDLSSFQAELSNKPYQLVIKENLVLFHIQDAGTFSIQDGKRITVSPIFNADEDLIRLYILGSCMGVILMQRRIYPLHGSAVVINNKAYAIIGNSGAGKSTLASAFISKGYKLLSDDVIAISLSSDGIPIVTPSYPQQKLWQQSLDGFGMKANQYRAIYGRETKYNIPINSDYYAEPLPLAGVFELNKTDNEYMGLERIQGLHRLHTMFRHTYRHFLIAQLGLLQWHFDTSVGISNQINMFRIWRPNQGFTVYELADLIVKTLNQEE